MKGECVVRTEDEIEAREVVTKKEQSDDDSLRIDAVQTKTFMRIAMTARQIGHARILSAQRLHIM